MPSRPVFTPPQKQTWNQNVTDRSPGVGLFLSIWFFSNLPSTDMYNISIPCSQSITWYLIFKFITGCNSSLCLHKPVGLSIREKKKKRVWFHLKHLLSSLSLLTKETTDKMHNLQSLNKRFWPQLFVPVGNFEFG